MEDVYVSGHPLIHHKLSIIRDKKTGIRQFRETITEVSQLLVYEVAKDLPLEDKKVETPLTIANCKQLAGKKLVVVPILRAGLGMVDGFLSMMPSAKVGHIGLARDHKTLMPIAYYHKLPEKISERDVIILDPMLATGGSINAAITYLKQYTPKSIKLMCIIAASEGVKSVHEKHPEVPIYCAAIDDELDERGYIMPGLGDAGDRIFGTL